MSVAISFLGFFIGLVPCYLHIFENPVFSWEGMPNMSQQHASSPVDYTLVCTWVAIFIPLQLFWRVLFYPGCAWACFRRMTGKYCNTCSKHPLSCIHGRWIMRFTLRGGKNPNLLEPHLRAGDKLFDMHLIYIIKRCFLIRMQWKLFLSFQNLGFPD